MTHRQGHAPNAHSEPPGTSTPWWRQTAGVSLLATAVISALLGAWLFAANSPQTSNTQTPAANATPDAMHQVLRAGKPTIIEFGANNCVSCREMKPILHALAQDSRIAVADVDILKEREYISKYQIRLMPTQVFYNAQGIETGRHMGKISAQEILAQLGMMQTAVIANPAANKAAL